MVHPHLFSQRWLILIILSAAYFFVYFHRISTAVLAPYLIEEFPLPPLLWELCLRPIFIPMPSFSHRGHLYGSMGGEKGGNSIYFDWVWRSGSLCNFS